MFRVGWTESALNALTSLWLAADPNVRRAITAATEAVDRRLQINALYEGESRPGGRRILFAPPLTVLFVVDRFTATATVTHVWRPRGGRRRP
jgi:hypothetical protein